MAQLRLNDSELATLIMRIVTRGKIPELLEFLETVPGEIDREMGLHGKRLAFMDYDLTINGMKHDGQSTQDVELFFDRSTCFLGWVKNRRLIRLLIQIVRKRYVGSERQVDGVQLRGGADLLGSINKITWRYETTIEDDPWASRHGRRPFDKYDRIRLSFHRRFD
jgi:hypothetical protein